MQKSWLEVSLEVDGELAEAVAEVLARFAPNGVLVESTAVTSEADDSEGMAIGPLRVAAFLEVNEHLEEQRQKLEEALWYLSRIQDLPKVQYRVIEEENWAEAWKVHFQPISVGRRLMIVPAWLENPTENKIAVRIDPGMAFGTGTHPTTQLCLELIEAFFNQQARPSARSDYGATSTIQTEIKVIDVGCGSGILAIAALKMGAGYALGVDIDPDALTASQKNARLNEVEGRLEVNHGSLLEIQSGHYGIKKGKLILANILAPVLIRLLDEGLGKLLDSDGWLILSGILAEQSLEVEEALSRNGLFLEQKLSVGDWVALVGVNKRP